MKKILFLSLTLFSLASITACAQKSEKIKGSGNITKETRNPGNFKGVELSGSMNVILTKGSGNGVVVETDDNIIPYIVTEIKDGSLRIGTKPNTSIDTKKITVYVTLSELNKAAVSGSGNIKSDDTFTSSGDFTAAVSGSGNCQIHINAKKLDARISGSGDIHISGSADNTTIAISGSGNYKGAGLETKDATVRISGSGGVETAVSGQLEGSISGSGTVKYKGNPAVQVKTSGSGRVSKI
jgi:hypothetical protein